MDFERFETHGSRFDSFVRPARGSHEICAWRVSVPAGLAGVEHRPDREEVLLGLDGTLRLQVDGDAHLLGRGDVVLVPAGARFRVDGGEAGGSAWVTTTAGLTATLPDGERIEPPWAR